MSTVSKTDVYAVLIALTEVIPAQLEDGKIIRLGEMGSFTVGLNSHPSDTEEDVSAADVIKLKIRYRPSVLLKRTVEAFPITKSS